MSRRVGRDLEEERTRGYLVNLKNLGSLCDVRNTAKSGFGDF